MSPRPWASARLLNHPEFPCPPWPCGSATFNCPGAQPYVGSSLVFPGLHVGQWAALRPAFLLQGSLRLLGASWVPAGCLLGARWAPVGWGLLSWLSPSKGLSAVCPTPITPRTCGTQICVSPPPNRGRLLLHKHPILCHLSCSLGRK